MQAQLSSSPAASAYAPADLTKRIIAAFIDGAIVSLLAPVLLAGFVYHLIKDGLFDGRSVGKKVMGLRVVNVDTGQPCDFKASAVRHGLGLVPCVNVFYLLAEVYMVVTKADRRRISDGWAHTMVIEG
jgi:uncharacterized RDD family membrane protein YckC